MAKKTNSLENGFLILYDWLPALESLSGDNFKAIVLALMDRQRNGTPLPAFEDKYTDIFARMIEPIIMRRLYGQSGGNKAQDTQKDGTTQDTTQGTTIGTTQDTAEARKDKIRKDKIRKDNTTRVPRSSPPTGSDVYAERFDEFWKAYPKKVGKEAARKAFMKIKPSADLLQRMLEAIKEQKASDQWKRDNGQYIPNPATWLNQGRWDDETHVPAHIKDDMDLEEFFNGH